mmetsp:Transcript_31098/g.47498  ORF Transcript_31098/g.47498 Transcript_31098/m.47498 type:complete len:80 (-) Transcript_31098:1186-1425(-)
MPVQHEFFSLQVSTETTVKYMKEQAALKFTNQLGRPVKWECLELVRHMYGEVYDHMDDKATLEEADEGEYSFIEAQTAE